MNSRSIILTAALTIGLGAAAQDLATEVVVDRTVTPAERAATRLPGLTPRIVLPASEAKPLWPAVYTQLADVARAYSPLSPAYAPLAGLESDRRGYFSLGYFPLLDFTARAGYRIIQSEKIQLGVRATFDSKRYSPLGSDYQRQTLAEGTIAADLAWRPSSAGCFTASLSGDFAGQRTPWWDTAGYQGTALQLGWEASSGRVDYAIDVKGAYDHFGGVSDPMAYIQPQAGYVSSISQRQLAFGAEAALALGSEATRIGLAADGDFVNSASTYGTVGLTPFFVLATEAINARVGIMVDFDIDPDGTSVKAAPELRLNWRAAGPVGVWAAVSGGSVMNPLRNLRAYCPWQVFTGEYRCSDIPVMAELGLNLGTFSGFGAEIFGGYAAADDWLVLGTELGQWEEADLRGWHAGLRLSYDSRLITATAGATLAGTGRRAWLRSPDQARYQASASVDAHPLQPLTVGLGYEFRAGRCVGGCVSDLSAHADYRITPAFTVFARVDNILGRRYQIMPRIYSQKQNGAVGVALKF